MAPPLDWTITHFSQTWTGQGLYIQVTTDVPCTLYLLWTTITPRLHLRSLNKRGLGMMDDPYYCFVEWNRVEQWIKGDAKHHSFFLGDWKPGEYRYFIFVATFAGDFSQGTSPIFVHSLEAGPVAAPIIATPYLTWTYPITPVRTVRAFTPVLIPHIRSLIAAIPSTYTPPWVHPTTTIIALYALPLPRLPSPIVATFSIDTIWFAFQTAAIIATFWLDKLWIPTQIATIEAEYSVEVT